LVIDNAKAEKIKFDLNTIDFSKRVCVKKCPTLQDTGDSVTWAVWSNNQPTDQSFDVVFDFSTEAQWTKAKTKIASKVLSNSSLGADFGGTGTLYPVISSKLLIPTAN